MKKHLTTILHIIQIFLLLFIVYQLYQLDNRNSRTGSRTESRKRNVPKKININMSSLIQNSAFKGDENAPVTIIEFSDYQCPYCGRFYSQTLPLIEENYIKTGKVRLVIKYYPGHGSGELAMKMMLCGNEQGKFWDLHDLYFANQDKISDAGSLRSLASGAGIDMAKLDTCLSSGRADAKIAQDIKEGQSVGVRGTPAFYLNGKNVPGGAIPYSTMKQAIDSALSG